MWRIRELVLFAFSVLMTVRAGTGQATTTYPRIEAKNGQNVTLPCSHRWNLSKKEALKTLDHVTWFLMDPDNPDTTIASHECQRGHSPASCRTTTSNSQTSLDLDFDNKTANLIIADVRSTDSGLYLCEVVTTKGSIQQTVSLSVSGIDTSIRIKSSGGVQPDDPSKIIVTADTEETLTCSTFLSKDFTGNISWNSNGLNLTKALQNQISINEDEDYVTSSVTFHPTHADNNKWVECGITESTKSPRRISLKVQDKTDKLSQADFGIPINNGTSSQVCFYHQSREATPNKTCCQADDIVFLPNRLSNGDISILCCKDDVCQAFQLNIVDVTAHPHPVASNVISRYTIFIHGLCVLFFNIILILSCGCCFRRIRKLRTATNVNADIYIDVTNSESMQARSLSSAYQDLNAPPRLPDRRRIGVLRHDYESDIATDDDGRGDLNLSQCITQREQHEYMDINTNNETPDNDLDVDGYILPTRDALSDPAL